MGFVIGIYIMSLVGFGMIYSASYAWCGNHMGAAIISFYGIVASSIVGSGVFHLQKWVESKLFNSNADTNVR